MMQNDQKEFVIFHILLQMAIKLDMIRSSWDVFDEIQDLAPV